MPFDALVANPGRLRILTTLAASGPQEFVHLRLATKLSDGNLATHARRLKDGGLIAIHKEFRGGKPVTRFALNTEGRAALESHARELLAAIGMDRMSIGAPVPLTPSAPAPSIPIGADDEWID